MSTILIVDDESALRNVLVEVLQDEGYTVWSVTHGQAALEFMLTTIPDVVITDYMMPRLNGIELAQVMAETPELAKVSVVLMSSSSRANREHEVDVFLKKPFDIDLLLSVIANLVDHA